jgi:hypothetical protein
MLKFASVMFTIWRIDTEKTMKDLSQFYVQKVPYQMAGPVKNASRLWDRSLLAETRIDNQRETPGFIPCVH